jgi:hypothetical protein
VADHDQPGLHGRPKVLNELAKELVELALVAAKAPPLLGRPSPPF